MKKLLLILFLTAIVAANGFSMTSLNTLTFYTVDLENGQSDIFPIVYFVFEPIKGFSLRFEDYLALTHDTLSFGPISIMKPRFYYVQYMGNNVSLKIGNFRSKHYNTRKINLLRVGGFYDYNYGIEVGYTFGKFSLFGRYNYIDYYSEHQYGSLIAYDDKNLAFGLYLMKKGTVYDLSADGIYNFSLGPVNGKFFGAIAAYGAYPFIALPTYLVGGLFNWNRLDIGIQFAQQGSWSIDYDFGDPNKGASWVLNTYLNYNFTSKISAGVFFDQNSSGMNYGTKLNFAGLEIVISNSDYDGGMTGIQRLELSYSNYFSIDIEKAVTALIKTARKFPKISEIRESTQIGDNVTIRGVVAADTDLLGNNVTYVVDETGGYMIWGRNAAGLKAGDEVIISGYTKEYYGIVEIVVDSVDRIASGKKVPVITPKVIDIFSGKYESAFVKVTGKVIETSKYSIVIRDDTANIKIYAKKGTNVSFENVSFGDIVTVYGIVSQFQGEWEIIPRSQSDVVF
ncbi:hypothetical protein [Kosmotoga pacifica]|uniref:DNA-binding protein n=1 Tax=Kosmotoga pacifica TaxID=1330330 RepID=A0A0G2Z5L5_9BACT|nr:hypothetical protein [Kosmotoga pacifica]AKI96857.1 hypothetical protein IX53_02380 [Kosmotoga pacifica]